MPMVMMKLQPHVYSEIVKEG